MSCNPRSVAPGSAAKALSPALSQTDLPVPPARPESMRDLLQWFTVAPHARGFTTDISKLRELGERLDDLISRVEKSSRTSPGDTERMSPRNDAAWEAAAMFEKVLPKIRNASINTTQTNITGRAEQLLTDLHAINDPARGRLNMPVSDSGLREAAQRLRESVAGLLKFNEQLEKGATFSTIFADRKNDDRAKNLKGLVDVGARRIAAFQLRVNELLAAPGGS